MFMSRSFSLQKRPKQFKRSYNSIGDGAIRTKSSAKASMKNYSDAIVYACLLLWSMLHVLQYYNRYGYTRSKNIRKSSGEAPSPCFIPIFAKNSYTLPVYQSVIIPLDCKYIFRIIVISATGMLSSSPITYHNFSLFMESCARRKSIKAGFRAHHTTIEQALILQTIIQHSIKAKQKLGMAFIDMGRAYDSINREKLW